MLNAFSEIIKPPRAHEGRIRDRAFKHEPTRVRPPQPRARCFASRPSPPSASRPPTRPRSPRRTPSPPTAKYVRDAFNAPVSRSERNARHHHSSPPRRTETRHVSSSCAPRRAHRVARSPARCVARRVPRVSPSGRLRSCRHRNARMLTHALSLFPSIPRTSATPSTPPRAPIPRLWCAALRTARTSAVSPSAITPRWQT